jgi:NAD(P) transhydrogenase
VTYDYDLLSIGCGPAGQKAAIQTAKLGKRSGVVERRQLGGICVITGTIPSKTLREAVLHLTGFRHRGAYGQSYRVKEEITAEDLQSRYIDVVRRETDIIRDQLTRNHVAILEGSAKFVDPHTLIVTTNGSEQRVTAENVVIATGTRPSRPPAVDIDERTLLES